MKLNPRTMAYVAAVAEERSFSKAAEKLFITQPSLSQHILNAEKTYGVQFFDRKAVPLTLTYAGERFLAIGREMELLDERLTREMEDISGNIQGRIVVGSTITKGPWFIPKLFAQFQAEYPGVELVLKEGSNAELLSYVKTGQADIAFVGYTDPKLKCKTISGLTLMLSMRRDRPIAQNLDPARPVDLRLFQDEPFILLREGQSIRKITNRLFEKAGFLPKAAFETRSYSMAFQMAREGLGCTFTVSYEMYPAEDMVQFSIQDAEDTYPLLLVYRGDSYLSKPLLRFITLSEEIEGQ